MESIGEAAQRLLQRLDARRARNTVPGRRYGPGEIQCGPGWLSTEDGHFSNLTERRPAPNADSFGDQFTVSEAGVGLPGRRALGIGMQPPLLDRGGMAIVPRTEPSPVTRRPAMNDNRPHDRPFPAYGMSLRGLTISGRGEVRATEMLRTNIRLSSQNLRTSFSRRLSEAAMSRTECCDRASS